MCFFCRILRLRFHYRHEYSQFLQGFDKLPFARNLNRYGSLESLCLDNKLLSVKQSFIADLILCCNKHRRNFLDKPEEYNKAAIQVGYFLFRKCGSKIAFCFFKTVETRNISIQCVCSKPSCSFLFFQPCFSPFPLSHSTFETVIFFCCGGT